jgi:hypothetical protein
MSRPVGNGIRKVCAALERMGPSTSPEVAQHTGIDKSEISRFAGRAEKHGLLTIDRSTWPNTYTVVRGWEHIADRPPKQKKRNQRPVNSVWQLGERAGANL